MSFKVVSWNILAQTYATKESFPECDSNCLEWEHRKELIKKQIKEMNADILVLVEVEQRQLVDLFDISESTENEDIDDTTSVQGPIKGTDYYAMWYKKGDRICTDNKITTGSDFPLDGTVVIFNTKKFALVYNFSYKLSTTSQRAVIVKLQHLETNEILLLLAVHLKSKEQFADVRIEQMKSLFYAVKNICSKHDDKNIIIAGNFNEIKESGVFKTMLNDFKDSYEGKCPWTTLKKRDKIICRTIDYILYKGNLECVDVEPIPSVDKFPNLLPCMEFPSDHLPLKSTFKFIN